MADLNAKAKDIASKKSGLRVDQIERAVSEYRAATESLHDEPEWRAIAHMCGKREAMSQYGAGGTQVALQINSFKSKAGWEQEKFYTFDGKPFETFGEARAAELAATAKPKPYGLHKSDGVNDAYPVVTQ